jgi:tetratricopeptide (TPR) repeat protein
MCGAMAHPASAAAAGPDWQKAFDQAQQYSQSRKFDQALASAELALKIAEQTFGADDERAAQTLRAIAQIQTARHNVFQAEIFFERAVEAYKKIKGMNDPETANTMVQAGSLYLGLQRLPEAEELLRTGFEVLRNHYGKDDLRITMAMGGLAEVYKSLGDTRAIELFRHVIRILSSARGMGDPGVISSYYHLADIYEALTDYDNAAACYFTIIRALEEKNGIRHWELSPIYNNLGLVYVRSGQIEKAKGAYRHALDILVSKYGPQHPEVATVLKNLNNLYVQEHTAPPGPSQPLPSRPQPIRKGA